uniref:ribonuclease Z n=2 Tax=Kalanchoe fedtschenkoi TaxID=63787 RepID=A0A7N1A5V5_KALFE
MPPQLSNTRLLLSSSAAAAALSTHFLPLSKPFPLHSIFSRPSWRGSFTIFASSPSSSSSSYSRRHRHFPRSPSRRHGSTLREDKKDAEMEGENGSGGSSLSTFNKRRAEGRDKNDKPKNLQLKVRKLNPVNTICYLQILGTGMDTQDTSPSVLLFFDKQRFIFNAGEGLQRFCTEHKIKLSKIDHIFLSRVCSETAGGLPGLLLTLAGIGDEGLSVNVWGPSDLKYLVDAMKSFIPNAAMVHSHSFGPELHDGGLVSNLIPSTNPIVLVDDEVVKISAFLLQPGTTQGPQIEHLNGRLDSLNLPIETVEEEMHPPQESLYINSPKKNTNSMYKPGDFSVVYVCELPEIKGKFDPAKAAALGLKPGPKYRELQLGNSVKSDRQEIMVHPDDVMEPSIPGPIVILVDCPTKLHLLELLAMESLGPFYADTPGLSPGDAKTVNCIIHLTPSSISKKSLYQKWMKRFGAAQHIMAGHEMKNVEIPILKASARIAARLNHLCPYFFPAPGFWSCQDSAAGFLTSSEANELCESKPAENLLKFHLRPYAQRGLDRSSVPSLTNLSYTVHELRSEIPEVVDAAQEISKFWHENGFPKEDIMSKMDSNEMTEEPWLSSSSVPACLENITREDMEIVLLGTGSAQPSKYRNVTSIFINLFAKGSLLLDCGEGTLGQLKRRYGLQGADDAVRRLRCIWISHIHADHHTGLARILSLRRELLKQVSHEPLLVIGPRQLKRYLDAYHRLEDLDMQFLDCRHTTESSLKSLMEDVEPDSHISHPARSESHGSGIFRSDAGDKTPHVESTLFSKGSRMQSYWKRPNIPIDNNVIVPILKSMKKVLAESGIESLISVPVVHCPQAYGVVIKAAKRTNGVGKSIPGWKVVYSGDTRPCPDLVEAARGATVLIHEATFEDGLVDEAIARNHSTTNEAIEVGDAAGAYRIILTHFSQRYPKIPVFDEAHMHKTCIAFDMMSVNIADLAVLPKVLPYLKLLFKNEFLTGEESEDVVAAT